MVAGPFTGGEMPRPLADQALRLVEHNVEEGMAIGHALTYCSVLGQGACPITFLAGDLDAAERHCAALLDHTERHPIRLWHLWAQCLRGILMAKRGDVAAGVSVLRDALDQAGQARFLPRFMLPLGELAACLGEVGEESVLALIKSVPGNVSLESMLREIRKLTDYLGYEPHQEPPGGVGNTRNGTSPKTLVTEHGRVPIDAPRDRERQILFLQTLRAPHPFVVAPVARVDRDRAEG